MPEITVVLNSNVPSGNTVGNSGALTAIADSYNIPLSGGSPSEQGVYYHIKSEGYLSTLTTTSGVPSPGNLKVYIYQAGNILGTFTFLNMPAGLSQAGFDVWVKIVVTYTGTTGAYTTEGRMSININGVEYVAFIKSNTVTINTSFNAALLIKAQWSVSNAGNTVTFTLPQIKRGN